MPVNQLKAGVVLNYVVIILNTVVGLLYTPYMLRMMGQSEYGLYSLVASVIAYLTVLDLGFGNAIVRYTAKFRAEKKTEEQYEMFGMFFLLYLVIGIIAFGIGLGLYFNVGTLFGNTMTAVELDRARIMMLLLVANLAFTFPMSIWGSIVQAYEDFVFQKSLNIFRIILNTAVMICLLHFGYKAVAMVVVQTIFNVLTLVVNFIYCRRKLNIHIYFRFKHFHWGFLKEVAIYSFWIFLNAIMDRVYWSTGQFVLGAIVGTAAVAVFAIAIQLEGMYMQFSTAISSVFLPKVTAMVATNRSRKEISDLFIRTGRIQYIVLAYILSGFIIFGRQFIELWAGAGYSDAYIISLLFFIPLTVPLIQNLGITILQARNEIQVRIVHNHCPCQPWDANSADQIFRRHRLRNGRFGRIGRGTDTDNERILPAQAGPRHKDILEGDKQDVYNPHCPDIQLNDGYPSLLRIGLLGKTDTGDSGILIGLYPAVLPFQHDG